MCNNTFWRFYVQNFLWKKSTGLFFKSIYLDDIFVRQFIRNNASWFHVNSSFRYSSSYYLATFRLFLACERIERTSTLFSSILWLCVQSRGRCARFNHFSTINNVIAIRTLHRARDMDSLSSPHHLFFCSFIYPQAFFNFEIQHKVWQVIQSFSMFPEVMWFVKPLF